MQRSKQQALFFLLGAVLVGGVLGFASHALADGGASKPWAGRGRMYADLDIDPRQRERIDSLLDDRNCQIGAVMKPVRPQLDSIKNEAHKQLLQILTPTQAAKLESRRREMMVRDSIEKARRDSIRATTKTTIVCNN